MLRPNSCNSCTETYALYEPCFYLERESNCLFPTEIKGKAPKENKLTFFYKIEWLPIPGGGNRRRSWNRYRKHQLVFGASPRGLGRIIAIALVVRIKPIITIALLGAETN